MKPKNPLKGYEWELLSLSDPYNINILDWVDVGKNSQTSQEQSAFAHTSE